MKKVLLFALTCTLLLVPIGMRAQKSLYIPNEWKNFNSADTLLYKESDPNNQYTWSKTRSRESTNCIVYWQPGFGSDPTTGSITFDPDEVLQVAEACYAMEVNTLGFNATNMVNTYKLMILMNYTNDWICYGGGYDYKCSALWLNPSTVNPAGSALAHEVGHSFHYMCYGEDSNYGANSSIQTGFHGAVGNGAAIWETTANWQALATYPNEFFTESGMADVFQKSHNYAFTHEWHRYQAYPFFYYLCQYYNDVTTISKVWKQRETSVKDFNQVLMDTKSLSVEQLYRLHFEFAMRAVTWDLNPPSPYNVANYRNDSYIGKFNFNRVKLDAAKYQVAYASVPQSTGFNVIPLNIPSAGTTVTTKFTALAPGSALASGDPAQYLNGETQYGRSGRTSYNSAVSASARGFRLGYVVLKSDGTRVYYDDNTRHCTGTGTVTENVSYTVPAGAEKMWLVVSPTPSTYIQHQWDENFANDDQWPYQVEFVNTDILGESTIDGRDIADVTITYDVQLQPDATNYSGTTININGTDLAMIGTAFQMSGTDAFNYAVAYSNNQSNGTIMNNTFVNGVAQNQGSTALGDFGHWFKADGTVTNHGNNSVVFAEFDKSAPSVTIGQYPGLNSAGTTRTICEGLVYKDNSGNTATAYLVFNITFSNNATNSATISNIEYTNPSQDPTTYTYTIQVANGAPAGAGFTTQNGLTGSGNTYSITDTEITATNVADYVTATPVSGYASEITMSGTTITITYTATGETLNVERYTGQGYTASSATVDFTAAKAYLGVSEVTTDMLRIINPDESVISDYAGYDGWFATDGTAKTWSDLNAETEAADKAGICVKFFQAVSGGTYEICDMNGADVVGTTYTVKWALVANSKTYTYHIKVTFVERPAAEIDYDDLNVMSTINTDLTSSLGSYYEAMTADVDVAGILSTLSVSSLSDVTIYAVQSNGTLDENYMLGGTDGWRNAYGDWQSWGADARFCVKADFFATETEIHYVGGMIGQNTTEPATYTATYAFVKNGSSTNDAVILKVNLIYPEAEVLDIILADSETSYEVHTGNHNVTLERSLPAGKWLSFCAPFNIYGDEFEGMGISRAMSLESVTKNGGTITLNFADTDNIMVGVPVIIKMSETKTGITKNNTGYGSYEATPTTTVENGTLTAKMIGTYVKIDLPDDVYYLQDDKFRHTTYTGTTATAMKGWRAYFTITDSANEVKAVRYNLDGEDVEPTDIEGIVISTNDNVQSTIFDLSGRRVQHPAKGFYIVNGKKMFVK